MGNVSELWEFHGQEIFFSQIEFQATRLINIPFLGKSNTLSRVLTASMTSRYLGPLYCKPAKRDSGRNRIVISPSTFPSSHPSDRQLRPAARRASIMRVAFEKCYNTWLPAGRTKRIFYSKRILTRQPQIMRVKMYRISEKIVKTCKESFISFKSFEASEKTLNNV